MSAEAGKRVHPVLVAGSVPSALIFIAAKELAGLGWGHAIGLTVLLGLLPTVAVAQVAVVRELDIPRLQAYASSVATLVVLAVLSLGLSRLEPLDGLGFAPLPLVPLLGWTAGLVVAGLVTTLVFKWISMALGLQDAPLMKALLPETRAERSAFAGLSVAAGFGEEMAYRGYALGLLIPFLGTAWGVALSSGVFGILHAYQGVVGIIRTAVMGLLMAVAFLASGSLWPPVLAHALFDVLAGLYLAPHLMVPEAQTGVLEGEGTPDGV